MRDNISSIAADSDGRRLKKIKKLFDNGLITEKEYQSKREDVLKSI